MTALFFMCGFLATLNDILIPHLKSIFDLNYVEAMLVQFSFFSSFLLFAVPAGKLVEKMGYQKTLMAGLFTMAAGAWLFIPAASVPAFVLFMAALVVLAAGVTALQVSGNPYVSCLGSPRTASSRLNLTQGFNSLGSTIAPYFGGILILGAARPPTLDQIRGFSNSALQAYRLQQASYVKAPYVGIGLTLCLLALLVATRKLPGISGSGVWDASAVPIDSLWKHPHVLLGAIGIFVYCGAEIAIGGFLVNFLSQANIGHMSLKAAASYVSLYWGGSMLGRFTGSALLRKVNTGTLVGANAGAAFLLVALAIFSSGRLAMWAILLVGLFNSILFPSLFTLGIAGLGELTSKASGVLMSAAVGAAVVPVIQGAVADRAGVQISFLVPALCYIYVAFYGFKGSKPVRRGLQSPAL